MFNEAIKKVGNTYYQLKPLAFMTGLSVGLFLGITIGSTSFILICSYFQI